MRKRHGVLGLLCVVSVITFLDRLAIPLAEPGIRGELHLTPEQWGWVLSAYVLANALFEIPSGALGDRNGQRLELTRITAWWSGFTAATAWCRTFWQMAAARFLFGVGAAGAYPNAAGVISRWFPKQEHARAQGFVWGASRLGGALAPLLLVPLATHLGWRAIFWVLGSLGMVWSAVWWAWFRNQPAEMPGITEEELAEINAGQIARGSERVPWAAAVCAAATLADCDCLFLLRVGKLVLLRLVHHLAGARSRALRGADGCVCVVSVRHGHGRQPCRRHADASGWSSATGGAQHIDR